MMKKLFSLVLLLVFALVLSACTANEEAGKETDGETGGGEEAAEKVLYMNNAQEPTSFDPPIGFDSVSWSALNNLMEGLTRLGEDHQPAPAIAEKWDVSEDGKVYTFHLRDDAKWSNGDDVTAGDFVYAWKRLLNPDTGSAAAFLGYFIEGGEALITEMVLQMMFK